MATPLPSIAERIRHFSEAHDALPGSRDPRPYDRLGSRIPYTPFRRGERASETESATDAMSVLQSTRDLVLHLHQLQLIPLVDDYIKKARQQVLAGRPSNLATLWAEDVRTHLEVLIRLGIQLTNTDEDGNMALQRVEDKEPTEDTTTISLPRRLRSSIQRSSQLHADPS